MKTISGIMSRVSKEEDLESCGQRYASRNRVSRSAMINEVCDPLGWDRKHAIKALNGKVTLVSKAKERGSKPTHGEKLQATIASI